MKMENENQNINNNNKIENLKLYLTLFNILVLIDDIILHTSEIKFIFYYFQLLMEEVLIFHLWLSLRKVKIKLDKKIFSSFTGFNSLISILYFIFQLGNGIFEGKDIMKTVLFHQILNCIVPIILILYIIYFIKFKSYSKIESDNAVNLMDL